MPAAAMIPGLIGIGGSIAGGIAQRNAAGAAGNILNAAGTAAAANQQQVADDSANAINAAGQNAAGLVMGAGQQASQGILGAGQQGQAMMQNALAGLNPYQQTGLNALQQLNAGMAEGGQFRQQFAFDPNLMNDPGVQFRIQQGRQALENSATARGMLGGNTARAITDYAQGVASDEFNNAFQRSLAGFQTNRQAALQPLQMAMGMGLDATGQQINGANAMAGLGLNSNIAAGNALQGAASQAGNFGFGGAQNAAQMRFGGAAMANQFRTDAASAMAGAQMGKANALSGMMSGVAQGAAGIDWKRVFGRG